MSLWRFQRKLLFIKPFWESQWSPVNICVLKQKWAGALWRSSVRRNQKQVLFGSMDEKIKEANVFVTLVSLPNAANACLRHTVLLQKIKKPLLIHGSAKLQIYGWSMRISWAVAIRFNNLVTGIYTWFVIWYKNNHFTLNEPSFGAIQYDMTQWLEIDIVTFFCQK